MTTFSSDNLPKLRTIDAIRAQGRIVLALFLRETRTRFGKSVIGYTWALLEPIVHIVTWSALFMMLDRKPPVGESMALFVLTGVLPVMTIRNLTSQLTTAISANRSLLFFPLVTNTDVILGRALLEVSTAIFITVFFFAVCWFLGLPAIPFNPLGALAAMATAALLGTGVGFCNAIIATQMPNWGRVVGWGNRIAFMTSGIFFVPSMLPDQIQDILWYFPVTHLVDWFRDSFFFGYDSHFHNGVVICLLGGWTLFCGFALERLMRRKISAQ